MKDQRTIIINKRWDYRFKKWNQYRRNKSYRNIPSMNGMVVGTVVNKLRNATSSDREKNPVPKTGPRLRL